jgi:hypothetical protein
LKAEGLNHFISEKVVAVWKRFDTTVRSIICDICGFAGDLSKPNDVTKILFKNELFDVEFIAAILTEQQVVVFRRKLFFALCSGFYL